MARAPRDITMEGVQIRARNFSGKEGQYNVEGQRNFLVLIPTDKAAEDFEAMGLPVKYLKPKEEGDAPVPFLKVKVNIANDPMPRFVLITERGKTSLPPEQESMVILDWSDIIECDLILNPSNWEFAGKTGINVYLKAGYFKIREDELQLKYNDTPDIDSAKTATQSGVSFTPNDEFDPTF